MSKKLAIAMFGQKRLSREGGVEIVVKELCTRMAQNSLKTYNNQAMRLLREECRHEFGTNYEFAGDNSG